MSEMSLAQAVNLALRRAMAEDARVLILGEDVGVDGGVFRATDGLLELYGEKRVLDTPLAEAGIVGVSVGLAAQGFRPIPSPISGHIARLLARAGERVRVGAPLLLFEEGPRAETGTVVGDLISPGSLPKPPRPAAAPAGAAPPAAGRARASPAVRARAQALGVDPSKATPTGPGGSITLADVEKAAAFIPEAAQVLHGNRWVMAQNMARAGREVVPATLQDEADIESWREGEDVTVRAIRAMIAACVAEPALNASFDAATRSLRPNAQIDLGVAIDSPEGLFVPVLRDIGRSAPEQWRESIEALKKGAHERSLTPAELRNPTITLSNFGSLGGRHATLVVMPPQVAILGVGRSRDAPARADAGIAMHRMLPLSLTFDHRAVTGGEAARFLRAVIADLAKPK